MPKRDYEAETLHWVVIHLNVWGRAILDRARWGYNPEYKNFGVAFEPSVWQRIAEGPPLSPAEHKGFCRALQSLEHNGLVEIVRRYGVKASHVRLTPRGLQVALRLSPWADPKAITAALEAAAWATQEHVRAVTAATEAVDA
jgi:hypothetical protein